MNEYRVDYCYKLSAGRRKVTHDVLSASSAQEAVERMRKWYGHFEEFRIEQVWVERDGRWEITKVWV